jgi:hypothetical protein
MQLRGGVSFGLSLVGEVAARKTPDPGRAPAMDVMVPPPLNPLPPGEGRFKIGFFVGEGFTPSRAWESRLKIYKRLET